MKQSRYRDLHFLQTESREKARKAVEDVNPALDEAGLAKRLAEMRVLQAGPMANIKH